MNKEEFIKAVDFVAKEKGISKVTGVKLRD